MLTKKQLEDAAECAIIDCADCSIQWCINTIEVTRRSAQTALAYREILERHIIEEGHYSSLEELAEVEKLLKESEGEEG